MRVKAYLADGERFEFTGIKAIKIIDSTIKLIGPNPMIETIITNEDFNLMLTEVIEEEK